MLIEAVIHAILASPSNPNALALNALLPIERITTGMGHERDLPYASVNLESNLPEFRSNTGAARQPTIRFQLWTEDHESGCNIREAVQALFENQTFQTDDYRLETRIENATALHEDDGVWQFLVDIETQYQLLP